MKPRARLKFAARWGDAAGVVFCLAVGLVVAGGLAACSPAPRSGPAAPDFPARAPLSPSVILTDKRVTAGTAFCIEEPGHQPAVLTAMHVFGPPGGLPARIKAADLPAQVQRVEFYDVFSGRPVGEAGRALALPAAPFDEASFAGDVAAFVDLKEIEPLGRLRLSADGATTGETVWLLAQVAGGAPPSQALHRAVVEPDEDPIGGFFYRFEAPGLDLTATSGAPVLNAKGEVIAIHLSAMKEGTAVVGYGHPTSKFRGSLLEALDADCQAHHMLGCDPQENPVDVNKMIKEMKELQNDTPAGDRP